jgi:hypothetical protein
MTVDEVGIFADVVRNSDGLIYTFILWSVFMIFVLMGAFDLDIFTASILSPVVVFGIAILIFIMSVGLISLLPILAGFFVLIFLFVYIPLSL